MNAMKPLLLGVGCVFALAAALPSEAASIQKPGSSGHWRGGGGGQGGGNWSGGRGNGGNWSGGHGHWRGSGHYYGYRGYGYRGYYPWWGFYAAAPFVFGAYYSTWDPYWGGYWGPRYSPYAYDRAYPRYYEDDPQAAMSRPGDQDLGPAPSPVDPTAPGAPTQGPLYMNYCASAKAYYPKVTSCPEGWVFQRPKYD